MGGGEARCLGIQMDTIVWNWPDESTARAADEPLSATPSQRRAHVESIGRPRAGLEHHEPDVQCDVSSSDVGDIRRLPYPHAAAAGNIDSLALELHRAGAVKSDRGNLSHERAADIES